MTDATKPGQDVVQRFGWSLLGLLGVVLLANGLLEFSTTWYPFNIGNPEWEFGTVSEFLDALPVLFLGLGLTTSAAVARGGRGVARAGAVFLFLMTAVILFAALLYATNLPQAVSAMRTSGQMTVLKKAIVKSVVQSLVYPIGFIWLAVATLRRISRQR